MNKNFPLAFLLGYLLPGWGHFYLGKRALGLFFSLTVLSMYGIGVLLKGGVLWDEMNILTVLAYTVKFFNGIPFLVTFFQQIFQKVTFYFNDIGTTFILVSGSLNVLIMIHLIDVVRELKEKQ